MQEAEPQTLVVGSGATARNIAYRARQEAQEKKPGVVWLSGFMSDMASTKATAVADWAATHGLSSTRFDYSGHGQSEGAFTDGTIGRWLEETYAIFTRVTSGPQIIVGSSMGGYIALLLLRKLLCEYPSEAHRMKAPYPSTRQLIEDGRQHLLAREPFDPGCPVVILQGLLDPDVPAAHTRELANFLTGGKVKLIEIADAEHRLSRPQDLALLFAELDALT